MRKIGERVGAIKGEKDGVVEFFGYGVYEGDFAFAIFGDDDMFPNPRIKLDRGGYVQGCQCWWGSETRIKGMIEAFEKAGKPIQFVEAPQKETLITKGEG